MNRRRSRRSNQTKARDKKQASKHNKPRAFTKINQGHTAAHLPKLASVEKGFDVEWQVRPQGVSSCCVSPHHLQHRTHALVLFVQKPTQCHGRLIVAAAAAAAANAVT